jgi:hypothetical protein
VGAKHPESGLGLGSGLKESDITEAKPELKEPLLQGQHQQGYGSESVTQQQQPQGKGYGEQIPSPRPDDFGLGFAVGGGQQENFAKGSQRGFGLERDTSNIRQFDTTQLSKEKTSAIPEQQRVGARMQ